LRRDGYDTGYHDRDTGYHDRYEDGYRGGQPGPGFAPPGHDDAGYPVSGRENAGYADPRSADPRYADPRSADPRYADPRSADPRYADPRSADPRYSDPGYADPRYADPRHSDPGYADPRYPDAGHDDRYPASGQAERGYSDRGYGDPRRSDPGYADPGRDGRYPAAGYDDRDFDHPDHDRGRFGGPGGRGDETGYADPDGVADGEGRRKPRRKRRVLLTFVLVLVVGVVGVVGLAGFRVYQSRYATPDYSGSGSGTAQVVVNSGDTASLIGATLTKSDVIKSVKAFIKAAAANPDSVKIQPGSYTLHKRMSASNALSMLLARNPDGNLVNLVSNGVTITEGMISVDIFEKLHEKTGIALADFVTAAKDPGALGVASSWFTRDDGKQPIISVEGFLFPDTYTFTPGETAKQMLSAMVKEFMDATGAGQLNAQAGAKTLGMTPYEVLITASIAQAEAQSQVDMAGVAEVVYNRIYRPNGGDSGSKLEIDSEVNYWLRITGHSAQDSSNLTVSQLTNPQDPYSTHLKPGLPPGAISNPGKDALTAALHPDTTKRPYYYWQTLTGSPKVVYAKTGREACAQRHQSC
jgi:UPF0755 protein